VEVVVIRYFDRLFNHHFHCHKVNIA
jgi:hypothetical protein